MFDSTLEENLLQLPDLNFLLDRLHTRLDDEHRERTRFREWLTEDQKAEFIFGKIVMHSPASEEHNEVVVNLSSISNCHVNLRDLGKVRIEKALIGMYRNDYEPDLVFWKKEKADLFDPKMNVYPIPDLVVEVLSPGRENVKRDRETKFKDYAANAVPEYWIIDPDKQTVEQYLLTEEQPREYDLHKKVTVQDRIESKSMTGFNIPVLAIFDAKTNVAAIAELMGK